MSDINIGKKLKDARKKKKLTQKVVGEMIYISESALSKQENDNGYPKLNILLELADLYDVSIDYLFSRDKFVACENDDKYYVRVSDKTLNLISILLSNEYVSLLHYLEDDPNQRLKIVKSKMSDYID